MDQAKEQAACLAQSMELVQCTLEKGPDDIAFHGRQVVQLDCHRALQDFEASINLCSTQFSQAFQEILYLHVCRVSSLSSSSRRLIGTHQLMRHAVAPLLNRCLSVRERPSPSLVKARIF